MNELAKIDTNCGKIHEMTPVHPASAPPRYAPLQGHDGFIPEGRRRPWSQCPARSRPTLWTDRLNFPPAERTSDHHRTYGEKQKLEDVMQMDGDNRNSTRKKERGFKPGNQGYRATKRARGRGRTPPSSKTPVAKVLMED